MSTILPPRKWAGLTRFRGALLASAAVAALCLTPARPAQAECSFRRASEEIICTGDVSGGCDAAWMAGRRHRSNVLRHDLSYVRVHLRIRKNGSRPAEQK